MHQVGKKNKYVAFPLMKISKDYFALGRAGIHKVSAQHAQTLSKFTNLLSHVVTSGLDARYDQVTIVEADTLEEIHEAVTDFRMGEKAKFIDIVDIVIGIKAPPRGHGTLQIDAGTAQATANP